MCAQHVGDPKVDTTWQGYPTRTFSVYREKNLNLPIVFYPLFWLWDIFSFKYNPQEEVDAAVKVLLDLKAQYKAETGVDLAPPPKKNKKDKKAADQGANKDAAGKNAAGKKKETAQKDDSSREVKKVTRLGMEVGKEENFSEWYSQVEGFFDWLIH